MRRVDLDSDRPFITALIAEAIAAGDPAPLSEEAEWGIADATEPRGLVAFRGDRPVAYIHLRDDGKTIEPVFAAGLRDSYVARVIEDALSVLGAGVTAMWTSSTTAAAVTTGFGFVENRRVVCLQRPLPVAARSAPRTGVRVASFRPGVDEAALLMVHNEAFSGNPDLGDWGLAAIRRRTMLPWFDPDGVMIGWDRGRPVGLCWTKASPPGVGELYLIAVRPDSASRGIGKALAMTGLKHLIGLGATTGRVFTDADNAPAAKLYGGLGFEVVAERWRLVRA